MGCILNFGPGLYATSTSLHTYGPQYKDCSKNLAKQCPKKHMFLNILLNEIFFHMSKQASGIVIRFVNNSDLSCCRINLRIIRFPKLFLNYSRILRILWFFQDFINNSRFFFHVGFFFYSQCIISNYIRIIFKSQTFDLTVLKSLNCHYG